MYRRQLTLIDDTTKTQGFGGSLSAGKRKVRRPFSRRKPMHIVLRSESGISLLAKSISQLIRLLLQRLSRKWSVTLYSFSIGTHHIHLLVRAKDKAGFQNFLRAFAGVTALKITRSTKGKPLRERFWQYLCWSRVVEWGRSFFQVKAYILKNQLEALGLIPYTRRTLKRVPASCSPPTG